MAHFLLRLSAPRPTFPFDMSEEEAALFERHFAYWRQRAEAGAAIAVGPVFDPDGPWELALIEAADEAEAMRIGEDDPVIQAKAGFAYTIAPIPSLILRPR